MREGEDYFAQIIGGRPLVFIDRGNSSLKRFLKRSLWRKLSGKGLGLCST